jgi:SAM-dependent methyltransferase
MSVLRNSAEVATAETRLRELGLPEHAHVREKGWDLALAIELIVAQVPRGGRVLDAGANVSPILEDLVLLGYRDLWAVDIVASRRVIMRRWLTRSPIRFRRRDMTRSGFETASFDAVSCLSVIEHGVDLDRFWMEMARVLKDDGLLAVSTDYWCEPIDTSGLFPYGPDAGEMKIFGPEDVRAMVASARSHGLQLLGDLRPEDLECEEALIEWLGKHYTFAFLAFRRAPR